MNKLLRCLVFAVLAPSVISSVIPSTAEAQIFRRCQPSYRYDPNVVTWTDVIRVQYYSNQLNALNQIAVNTAGIRNELEIAREEQQESIEDVRDAIREQIMQRVLLEALRQRVVPPVDPEPQVFMLQPQQFPSIKSTTRQLTSFEFKKPKELPTTTTRQLTSFALKPLADRCPGGVCPVVKPTIQLQTPTVSVSSEYATWKNKGVGTHIGDNYVLTVGHLFRRGWTPKINGQVATLVKVDGLLDLAVIKAAKPLRVKAVPVVQYQPKQNDQVDGEGVVAGYFGKDLAVRTRLRTAGLSGSPIFIKGKGLVSVVCMEVSGEEMVVGPSNKEVFKFVSEAIGD